MQGAAMDRKDAWGLVAVALAVGLLLAYRHVWVEPREWGSICAAASPPLACIPRAALLWLQYWELWGLAALILGLAAFLGAPVSAAAVAVGAAAVINYNASWGMLGVALGGWSWIRRARG
jgi:hypothetical protein